MDFKKLTDQAKRAIDKRGGTEALKGNLNELKDVAKGQGTLKEKAKAAAEAVKQPGTTPDAAAPATSTAPPTATTPTAPPTAQDLPPRS